LIVALQLDAPMPSPASSPISLRELLRRFRRNRRASAALEFALVAPVFFALLFAIIETALVFFANQVLETVTQDSARMIFTGQAQNASITQDQFRTYVCSQIPALFKCDSANLYIDVESSSSASSVTFSDCTNSNGDFNSQQFKPGGASDTVVVQLCYRWPIFVTGLGYNIANLPGSKRLLKASAAFRNEPYNG
jgi:Flp pilus assembly protein TadG